MSSSKIISSGKTGRVRQWQPPSMDQPEETKPASDGSGPLLTAEQLEKLQQQAYEEGFEKGRKEGFEYGHKEGLVKGQEEIDARIVRLDQLMMTLEHPLEQLDEEVERELLDLVVSIVKQLVRREVKTDPGQIVGVLREALGLLPLSSRNIRVLLHPDDAVIVKRVYEVSDKELNWKIVEDPLIGRGGCRVLTETSQVDATLESRLATLIAPLLSGERTQDNEKMDMK